MLAYLGWNTRYNYTTTKDEQLSKLVINFSSQVPTQVTN